MAAGSFTLYNQAKQGFFDGSHDWDTDSYYLHLLDAAYTPAVTHNDWQDVSANETTETSYAAQAIASKAVNGGTATATVVVDAANVSFGTNVSISAQYAVVRKGTATPGATDLLVGYVSLDTGGAVTSTNGTFEVQWHASNGLFTVA